MVTNVQTQIIEPTWNAPSHIHGFTTTRIGGVSNPPYESWNMGAHVEDSELDVAENRRRLVARLPNEPQWLEQVHKNAIVDLSNIQTRTSPQADGATTVENDVVCAIQTADCLPVLLTDSKGNQVAALHAGWRSLAADIISLGIKRFACKPEEVLVWLGPAIGPEVFEVGAEVKAAYIALSSEYGRCFQVNNANKFKFDIYAAAKIQCALNGVYSVAGGSYCTYSEPEKFFSYRRDGVTGRMATVIWKSLKG